MSDPKLSDISGVGPATARLLAESGFASVEAIATATPQELARVPGFGEARAAAVIAAAGTSHPVGDAPGSGTKPRKSKKGAGKGKKKEKKGKKRKKKDGKKGKKGKKKNGKKKKKKK
jgi:transcription termination factor NusA